MISLVMTILGKDRPGVVESLARLVTQHQGNWLESRMAHLAGQFAGIVHVEVAEQAADQLIAVLRRLDVTGLTVIIQKDSESAPRIPVATLKLDVVGNDRPGIVSEVTRVLAELGVNVEEFETECVSAPMSGGRLFQAKAKLNLPPALNVPTLQSALEKIAHDLMVDIRLESHS